MAATGVSTVAPMSESILPNLRHAVPTYLQKTVSGNDAPTSATGQSGEQLSSAAPVASFASMTQVADSIEEQAENARLRVFGQGVAVSCLAGAAAASAVLTVGSGSLAVLPGLILAVAWTTIGTLLHISAILEPVRTEARSAARACGTFGLICWSASEALPIPLGSGQLLTYTLAAAGVTALARLTVPGIRVRSSALRTVVVGDEESVHAVMPGLLTASGGSLDPIRAIVVHPSTDPHLGGVTDADAILVIPGPHFNHSRLRRIAWEAERLGLPLLVDTTLTAVASSRATPLRARDVTVLQIDAAPRHGLRMATKCLWERCAAALTLFALAPALLIIAALVRIGSPGPAIFRQQRVGMGGRTFTMFKFRTMVDNAESLVEELQDANEFDAVLFKIRQDPRVTRIGRTLRRFSLDELPQLWNVVRGEMSLVGPRPALPEEVAGYDQDPRRRIEVKPGLTGLWQVSGRSDLDWDEAVRLDLDYVDNWSLTRDLQIVARTVGAVASHRGAY
ncbi:sugar transferase [soil metagenome]